LRRPLTNLCFLVTECPADRQTGGYRKQAERQCRPEPDPPHGHGGGSLAGSQTNKSC